VCENATTALAAGINLRKWREICFSSMICAPERKIGAQVNFNNEPGGNSFCSRRNSFARARVPRELYSRAFCSFPRQIRHTTDCIFLFSLRIARGNIHDECAQGLFYNETAGREEWGYWLLLSSLSIGMRRSKVEIFTSLWNLELTLIIFTTFDLEMWATRSKAQNVPL